MLTKKSYSLRRIFYFIETVSWANRQSKLTINSLSPREKGAICIPSKYVCSGCRNTNDFCLLFFWKEKKIINKNIFYFILITNGIILGSSVYAILLSPNPRTPNSFFPKTNNFPFIITNEQLSVQVTLSIFTLYFCSSYFYYSNYCWIYYYWNSADFYRIALYLSERSFFMKIESELWSCKRKSFEEKIGI